MKRSFLLLLPLLACATTAWHRPGATQLEFANEKQFCVLYARAVNDNPTWSKDFTFSLWFRQCMEERGWQLMKVEDK